MATNVPDADLIVKAARQASVKLMVDFHQRWNPACAHTKEAVKTGEIGKPMYVYTRLSNTILSPTEFIKWAAQTRVIWWLTVHTFDLARWFLEAEAKRVYAVAQSEVLKNRGIDTPDLYSAIVQFEGEKVANLESCWTLPNSFPSVGWGRWFGLGIDFKLELIGSNGAMYLDVMPNVMTQKYLEKEYTWPDTIDACLVHGKWSGFAFESINHFIECLASNKEPLSTGEDGLAATRAISAIEKSAESGQTVEI